MVLRRLALMFVAATLAGVLLSGCGAAPNLPVARVAPDPWRARYPTMERP